MTVIEVRNLRKTYGKTVAVDDVTFEIGDPTALLSGGSQGDGHHEEEHSRADVDG